MQKLFLFFFFISLSLYSLPAHLDPSSLHVQIDFHPKEIKIADETTLTIRISKDKYSSFKILSSKETETYFGEKEKTQIPIYEALPIKVVDKGSYFELTRKIKYFIPGRQKIPQLRLELVEEKKNSKVLYNSEELYVQVISILKENIQEKKEPEMFDILYLEFNYTRLITLIILVLIISSLTFLFRKKILFFLKGLKSKKIDPPPRKEIITPEKALSLFLKDLKELRETYKKDSQDPIQLFKRLDHAFITYLTRLFGFEIKSQTFSSLIQKIKRNEGDLPDKVSKNMKELFSDWTLYRYAKKKPNLEEVLSQDLKSEIVAKELFEFKSFKIKTKIHG